MNAAPEDNRNRQAGQPSEALLEEGASRNNPKAEEGAATAKAFL